MQETPEIPQQKKEDYVFAVDDKQDLFTCTYRPQASDIVFDFRNRTVTYKCFDTFGKDIADNPFDFEPRPLEFLQRVSEPKSTRFGEAKTVSLADYGISMISQDGKYLLPLHTAFDFMLWAPQCPYRILCTNNKAVFVGSHSSMFGYSDALSELGKLYFSEQPRERSSELAQYGYGELCLMLDNFFGLKETHHIDSFRELFHVNGYEESFLSTDPGKADQALCDTIRFILDDFHSSEDFPSWMVGAEHINSYDGKSLCQETDEIRIKAFEEAFAGSAISSGGFYTESGNTAYVVLTGMNTSIDSETFYARDLSDINNVNSFDTVEIVAYAHRMINRENSPIENVVIDISRNSGGDLVSSGFVLSWFLGKGYVTTGNTFSNGLGVLQYWADVNQDHQFNDDDCLYGKKNLFCLISPETFSSANMLANMLKNSGVVTILGQTSRGGSGMKTPAVTGWDTFFYISGFKTIATVRNGSWFDADGGAVPDVYIRDPKTFFDRDKLTEMINGIQ